MFEDIPGYINISLCLVALAVILLLWLYQSTLPPPGFPPGPTPVPFFGNLLMIKNKGTLQRHVTLYELSKIYGPIVGLKMGSRLTVVLNDYDVIEEALVKNEEAFTRPQILPVILHKSMKDGQPTSFWKSGTGPLAFRAFTVYDRTVYLTHMYIKVMVSILQIVERFFFENGRTKKSIESRLSAEVEMFCDELNKHIEKPFSLKKLNKDVTVNVLYQMVFGSRLPYKDKNLANFTDRIDKFSNSKHFGSIINFVPPLQYILGRKVFKEIDINLEELDDFTEEQIKEHEKTFNPKKRSDLIDHYCHESSGKRAPSLEDFQRIILDLNSGNYSIYAMLDWFWLLMASFPETQRQCQEEIDQLFTSQENNLELSFSDRENLPYVHATILETLRFVTPVPISVPYATVKDVMVSGYQIPKDTLILVNLYSMHRNEKYWNKADQFKPERWLNADGKVDSSKFTNNSGFVPFSIGRRSCLARAFAEAELFIFFVKVLRKFNFALVDPQNPPSLVGDLFLLMEPQPHQLIVRQR